MAATSAGPIGHKYKTIDEYHASFPAATQGLLDALRKTIRSVVPAAEEVISYNMPAFKQGAVLVYYAAYETHIGFYPTPQPIEYFKEELKNYKTSKGAIQFPFNKPMPLSLIKKITKYRAATVEAKFTAPKLTKSTAKSDPSNKRNKSALK